MESRFSFPKLFGKPVKFTGEVNMLADTNYNISDFLLSNCSIGGTTSFNQQDSCEFQLGCYAGVAPSSRVDYGQLRWVLKTFDGNNTVNIQAPNLSGHKFPSRIIDLRKRRVYHDGKWRNIDSRESL